MVDLAEDGYGHAVKTNITLFYHKITVAKKTKQRKLTRCDNWCCRVFHLVCAYHTDIKHKGQE